MSGRRHAGCALCASDIACVRPAAGGCGGRGASVGGRCRQWPRRRCPRSGLEQPGWPAPRPGRCPRRPDSSMPRRPYSRRHLPTPRCLQALLPDITCHRADAPMPRCHGAGAPRPRSHVCAAAGHRGSPCCASDIVYVPDRGRREGFGPAGAARARTCVPPPPRSHRHPAATATRHPPPPGTLARTHGRRHARSTLRARDLSCVRAAGRGRGPAGSG
jgi:hypothetical protein